LLKQGGRLQFLSGGGNASTVVSSSNPWEVIVYRDEDLLPEARMMHTYDNNTLTRT